MKKVLTLSLEEDLINAAEVYAQKQGISVNDLVEQYFVLLTKESKGKNIVELMDELPKINTTNSLYFKEEYYKKYKQSS